MNQDKALKNLQIAIQCQTISYPDRSLIDFTAYDAFIEHLKTAYPKIHEVAEVEQVLTYSLIYHIKGSSSKRPIALMSHYDVVPVSDSWKHEAFGGEIEDGYIYGRGTLDMKGHLIAMMEAMECLLNDGMTFERDVYLLIGHNEETGSNVPDSGALNTMKYLKYQGIEFHAVLDEGGAFIDGKPLGIDGKIALIGVAEKGYLDVLLRAKASGGHAAMPPQRSAVYDVCEAAMKMEKNKFKPALNAATDQMFDSLIPYMRLPHRYLFKYRHWIKPILLKLLTQSPMTAAIVRTTSVITMAEGSKAPNVLAQEAKININCRIVPGDTVEKTLSRIQDRVDDSIEVINQMGTDPTSVSPSQHRVFDILRNIVLELYPQYKAVAPYLMVAATDSRVYDGLSEVVYRIAPFSSVAEDLHTVHADDERLKIEDFFIGIDLFKKLIIEASKID